MAPLAESVRNHLLDKHAYVQEVQAYLAWWNDNVAGVLSPALLQWRLFGNDQPIPIAVG